MHILRTISPIPINYGQVLPAGEWLCQDEHAFQWAARAERGAVEVSKWVQGGTRWPEGDAVPRSILLIRSGAIGDLLLLTPATRALRAKYPGALIWLSCFKKHWDVFAQGDTHFIEYPLPTSGLAEFDLILPLENIVELSTDQNIHATDAYARVLGVSVTDYRPIYKVTEDELHEALFRYPRGRPPIKPKPRIGVQLHASSVVRDYPVQLWNGVLLKLYKDDWEIMLLGTKDHIPKAPAGVKDCSKLTFREAAAVLSTCDVFCGVDSVFFNLCPALGVPAIGLFGSVNPATRIKEGSGQMALTTQAECAPCGWTNSRGGSQWPANGPCAKLGFCEPLARIEPVRVVNEIEKHRK